MGSAQSTFGHALSLHGFIIEIAIAPVARRAAANATAIEFITIQRLLGKVRCSAFFAELWSFHARASSLFSDSFDLTAPCKTWICELTFRCFCRLLLRISCQARKWVWPARHAWAAPSPARSQLAFALTINLTGTLADSGGVRGVQMHPPLAASNVVCVHNCTSPSNDYAGVACSNNNQASYTLTYQFLTDLRTFD